MSTRNVFYTLHSVFSDSFWEIVDDFQSYVSNPSIDFSRSRSALSFENVFKAPFLFPGNASLTSSLPDLFPGDSQDYLPPVESALTAARYKIKPEAYSDFFHKFNEKTRSDCLFHSFRIVAVDGSEQVVFGPSSFPNMTSKSKSGIKRDFVHINALYDVLENTYIDAVIQPAAFKNEDEALLELAASHPELLPSSIFTADRGYESLMLFYRLNRLGAKFLIRIKDIESYSSILKHYNCQEDAEFDTWFNFKLCKSPTLSKKDPLHYKYLWNYQQIPEFTNNEMLSLNLRIVRFPIEKADGSIVYECLVTNVPEEELSLEDLKEVYHLRWPIETSFDHLKNQLDIAKLHSRTFWNIEQEVFARMALFNLSSRIRNYLEEEPKKKKKYFHKINFSNVLQQVKKHVFRLQVPMNLDIDAFLQRETVPVIPGRPDTRKKYKRSK